MEVTPDTTAFVGMMTLFKPYGYPNADPTPAVITKVRTDDQVDLFVFVHQSEVQNVSFGHRQGQWNHLGSVMV